MSTGSSLDWSHVNAGNNIVVGMGIFC